MKKAYMCHTNSGTGRFPLPTNEGSVGIINMQNLQKATSNHYEFVFTTRKIPPTYIKLYVTQIITCLLTYKHTAKG